MIETVGAIAKTSQNPDEAASPDVQPSIIVIFGITGDLAGRKLLPALYHLLKDGLLHKDTVILGITRQTITAEELLARVELCVNEVDQICDPVGIALVKQALQVRQMSLTDGSEYDELRDYLDKLEGGKGVCMNRLFYLSIPPAMYSNVVSKLGEHGLNKSCSHGHAASRLLVEKPFGYDLASAHTLIDQTGTWFSEQQTFRIDHYVAKETVQNILAFRLFNPLFSSIWNNRHIKKIEITAFEKIDIEGRAVFYEDIGALRDFIQSHLLQLLAIVTMELPKDLSSDAIHANKRALLQSIHTITADEIDRVAQRGQYDGYCKEVGNDSSTTETYAALQLQIDSERWQGIPLVLQTGKALADKRTDVRVLFGTDDTTDTNELTFHIQPKEGISLQLSAKKPGYVGELEQVVMDFAYHQTFSDANGHPDAYERVLVDAIRGDHTLFASSEEVLAAWQVVDAVIARWKHSSDGLLMYPKGSSSVS